MKNKVNINLIFVGILIFMTYIEINEILYYFIMDICQSMLILDFQFLPFTKLISIFLLVILMCFLILKISSITNKKSLNRINIILIVIAFISKTIGFFSGVLFNVVGYVMPTYIKLEDQKYWDNEYFKAMNKINHNEFIVDLIEMGVLLALMLFLFGIVYSREQIRNDDV